MDGVILKVISTMLIGIATLFMKKGSKKKSFLLVGVTLYGIASIPSVLSYRGEDLSTIYPLNSLSYLWSMILAGLILKEKIGVKKIVAIILLITGIFLVV